MSAFAGCGHKTVMGLGRKECAAATEQTTRSHHQRGEERRRHREAKRVGSQNMLAARSGDQFPNQLFRWPKLQGR